MAKKKELQKWYCTLRIITNEKGDPSTRWFLKQARQDAVASFDSQDQAIAYFIKLNVDGRLWFQERGKFTRTITSFQAAQGEESIYLDTQRDEKTNQEIKKLIKKREAEHQKFLAQKDEELNLSETKLEALQKSARRQQKKRAELREQIKDFENLTRHLELKNIQAEKQLQEERALRKNAESKAAKLQAGEALVVSLERELQASKNASARIEEEVAHLREQTTEFYPEKMAQLEKSLGEYQRMSQSLENEVQNVAQKNAHLVRDLKNEQKARLAAERLNEELRQTQIITLNDLKAVQNRETSTPLNYEPQVFETSEFYVSEANTNSSNKDLSTQEVDELFETMPNTEQTALVLESSEEKIQAKAIDESPLEVIDDLTTTVDVPLMSVEQHVETLKFDTPQVTDETPLEPEEITPLRTSSKPINEVSQEATSVQEKVSDIPLGAMQQTQKVHMETKEEMALKNAQISEESLLSEEKEITQEEQINEEVPIILNPKKRHMKRLTEDGVLILAKALFAVSVVVFVIIIALAAVSGI